MVNPIHRSRFTNANPKKDTRAKHDSRITYWDILAWVHRTNKLSTKTKTSGIHSGCWNLLGTPVSRLYIALLNLKTNTPKPAFKLCLYHCPISDHYYYSSAFISSGIRKRRRINTLNLYFQKYSYPRSIGFIISNEFCERFSFYGMKSKRCFYICTQVCTELFTNFE